MAYESVKAISLAPVETEIEQRRLVSINNAGAVAYATANAAAVGITLEKSAANSTTAIPVVKADGARVEVAANAAITAGASIAVATQGRAKVATTGNVVVGYALTASSAQNEVIDIIFTGSSGTV